MEQFESYCEDECDDDESLLLDKQFKDEFLTFCEKTSFEKQKVSSDYMKKWSTLSKTVRMYTWI